MALRCALRGARRRVTVPAVRAACRRHRHLPKLPPNATERSRMRPGPIPLVPSGLDRIGFHKNGQSHRAREGKETPFARIPSLAPGGVAPSIAKANGPQGRIYKTNSLMERIPARSVALPHRYQASRLRRLRVAFAPLAKSIPRIYKLKERRSVFRELSDFFGSCKPQSPDKSPRQY
jgi:hypothetical protein